MTRPEDTSEDGLSTTTEEEEEHHGIKPREIFFFLLFGLIPAGVLYAFASQGLEDARGEQFEQERRLLIDGCMKQLDDREVCRAIIDEPLIDCYKKFASKENGEVEERGSLRRCVTQREDDKFRVEILEERAKLEEAKAAKNK